MKYIFILSAIFMLASCQHKSSKEKAKEYWNNNQFELALIEISDAIKAVSYTHLRAQRH